MSGIKEDELFMKMALELALKGRGEVSPNPMVGCVMVKNGEVISKGWHRKYGELHAEAEAVKNAEGRGISLKGATAYVNLEPCSHYGRQPPCCNLLVEAGVGEVVVASWDPNPLVSGKGIRYLENSGIKVRTGILEEEAVELNKFFFHHIKEGLPFVRIKTAVTMDGCIAMENGDSKWITGEESRRQVHRDRGIFTGVMTGIGTVLKDNPKLTSRIKGNRNPIRIVVDRDLKIPEDSDLVRTAGDVPLIVVTGIPDKSKKSENYIKKRNFLKYSNVKVIECPLEGKRLDLHEMMKILGREGINSIYIECGGELSFSLLREGLVSEYEVYIAPKILGGRNSLHQVTGEGFPSLSHAKELIIEETEMLGKDLRILCKVIKKKR